MANMNNPDTQEGGDWIPRDRINARPKPARTSNQWMAQNGGGLAPDYSRSFGGLNQFYRAQQNKREQWAQAQAQAQPEAASTPAPAQAPVPPPPAGNHVMKNAGSTQPPQYRAPTFSTTPPVPAVNEAPPRPVTGAPPAVDPASKIDPAMFRPLGPGVRSRDQDNNVTYENGARISAENPFNSGRVLQSPYGTGSANLDPFRGTVMIDGMPARQFFQKTAQEQKRDNRYATYDAAADPFRTAGSPQTPPRATAAPREAAPLRRAFP